MICLLLTGCGGGGGNPLPPPAQVTGLGYNRTAEDPGQVLLNWSPGSRRATKGYLVARKFQGEAAFTRLMTTPLTVPTFVDRLPAGKELVTADYEVVIVDRKDRVGPTTPIRAIVAPPAPPF